MNFNIEPNTKTFEIFSGHRDLIRSVNDELLAADCVYICDASNTGQMSTKSSMVVYYIPKNINPIPFMILGHCVRVDTKKKEQDDMDLMHLAYYLALKGKNFRIYSNDSDFDPVVDICHEYVDCRRVRLTHRESSLNTVQHLYNICVRLNLSNSRVIDKIQSLNEEDRDAFFERNSGTFMERKDLMPMEESEIPLGVYRIVKSMESHHTKGNIVRATQEICSVYKNLEPREVCAALLALKMENSLNEVKREDNSFYSISEQSSHTPSRSLSKSPNLVRIEDAKGELNSFCQVNGYSYPVYTTKSTGPDHCKVFESSCVIEGVSVTGSAVGDNKKLAEKKSALSLIIAMRKDLKKKLEKKELNKRVQLSKSLVRIHKNFTEGGSAPVVVQPVQYTSTLEHRRRESELKNYYDRLMRGYSNDQRASMTAFEEERESRRFG